MAGGVLATLHHDEILAVPMRVDAAVFSIDTQQTQIASKSSVRLTI